MFFRRNGNFKLVARRVVPKCARTGRQQMLEQPLALPCGIILKNRVAKAAMTENLADAHGRATVRHCALYREWATGGAALLLTGNVQVDRRFLERPGNICVEGAQSPLAMERLVALAEAGSANGTQIWVQLGHAGRQSTAKVNRAPVGPSAVPLAGIPSFAIGHPRAMTSDEVVALPARFAAAAKACEAAGLGGVQVHAAHGYLLSSFLNPRANHRTDDYGGALAHRVRPLLEVLRAVRGAVKSGFGVGVKLNTADFQKGGFSHDDAVEVARMLAGLDGIDLLELSGGNYESPTICGNKKSVAAGAVDAATDGATAKAAEAMRESTRQREAYYLVYCRAVRAALKRDALEGGDGDGRRPQMALMLTGGFRSRTAMEAALRDGDVDVVGLGRPLCGAPRCVNTLLADTAAVLPAYEDELGAGGPGAFGSLLRRVLSSFQLGRTVLVITVQAWYYDMIYRIADGKTGTPEFQGAVTHVGVLGAWLRNEIEEGRVATALVGPDCEGTHYGGLRKRRKFAWWQKLLVAFVVFLIARRMVQK